MSVLQSTIGYIQTCPYIAEVGPVLTETIDEMGEIAVSPTTRSVIKQYHGGGAVIEINMALYLRGHTGDEADRAENNALLENFQDWVFEQQAKRNYPDLGPGKQAQSISAANGMPYQYSDDGTATYQVQIKLRYYQGR